MAASPKCRLSVRCRDPDGRLLHPGAASLSNQLTIVHGQFAPRSCCHFHLVEQPTEGTWWLGFFPVSATSVIASNSSRLMPVPLELNKSSPEALLADVMMHVGAKYQDEALLAARLAEKAAEMAKGDQSRNARRR